MLSTGRQHSADCCSAARLTGGRKDPRGSRRGHIFEKGASHRDSDHVDRNSRSLFVCLGLCLSVLARIQETKTAKDWALEKVCAVGSRCAHGGSGTLSPVSRCRVDWVLLRACVCVCVCVRACGSCRVNQQSGTTCSASKWSGEGTCDTEVATLSHASVFFTVDGLCAPHANTTAPAEALSAAVPATR